MAPSALADFTTASAFFTAKYTAQCGGIGPIAAVRSSAPATYSSPISYAVYLMSPIGFFSGVRPNSAT